MGEVRYDIDPLGRKIIGKVAWRLIPFMVVLYFLNYLDRVNVSFAALTMNADLGFSATVYGNGAGMLFLGYVVFMIPSNLILDRIGVRRWVAPITIMWGLLASLMAFVQGPVSFYVLRFVLGAAEAGFFPGMILYLTYWFPSTVRGRITSLFLLAIPLSSVVGAPVSTVLLDISAWGFKGWQWLFLIQGVPDILARLPGVQIPYRQPPKRRVAEAAGAGVADPYARCRAATAYAR